MKHFNRSLAGLCLLLLSLQSCRMEGERRIPEPPPPVEAEPAPPDDLPPCPECGETDCAEPGECAEPDPGTGNPGEPSPCPECDETDCAAPGDCAETDPGTGNPGEPSPCSECGETDCADAECTQGTGAPWLIINEVRTESMTRPSEPAHTHRSEFVEFRALSAGDLGGLRVFLYRSGAAAPVTFAFPPTPMAAGDYAVLFLRTLELPLADAYPAARNFWIPGSASLMNQNGAIYVMDAEDRVLAAVMISSSADPAWWNGSGRTHLARVAQFLFERGAWASPDGAVATPVDAVQTAGVGTSVQRTLSRDESVPDTGTAADWFVGTAATPGRANVPR